MEITKHQDGDVLEVVVTGRLDAYWSDHLSQAIDDAVREGAHRIRLHMAGVSFMSSLGIRVLVKFYKQLQLINGSFTVSEPSEAVRGVLELAGLDVLLAAAEGVAPRAEAAPAVQVVARDSATFEVHNLAPGARLRCRVVGTPAPLLTSGFGAAQCQRVAFGQSTCGIGLGALGAGFDDCRERFGEFLAAGGAAAYLPTDGTNVPDYLLAEGAFVPELTVLYGLVCDGAFSRLARFETAGSHRAATLSDIVDASLEIAGADAAAVVMLAESAGLMGVALRRSPTVASPDAAFFDHPQIRQWLSFTPERAFGRSLALVIGVVARDAGPELRALLRPVGAGTAVVGHLHAAAFSYGPIQKGRIDLQPTVAAVFETRQLQGVLHLVNDDREIVGGGQSEFLRGACWVGPIDQVVVERS